MVGHWNDWRRTVRVSCNESVKKKDGDGDKDGGSWESVYAGLIQNTSMTYKDIDELTVPQLEELYKGFEENNDDSENGGTLSDMDAIFALQKGAI